MDFLDSIELIFCILFLIYFIYAISKSFGIKGFLGSMAILVVCYIFTVGFDKFMDYAFDNAPWMILAFILLLAIIIIWGTVLELKKSYKKNPEKTKKYIIDQVKGLVILLGISALIMGIIVFVAFANA